MSIMLEFTNPGMYHTTILTTAWTAEPGIADLHEENKTIVSCLLYSGDNGGVRRVVIDLPYSVFGAYVAETAKIPGNICRLKEEDIPSVRIEYDLDPPRSSAEGHIEGHFDTPRIS